jgi:hypothetical protein
MPWPGEISFQIDGQVHEKHELTLGLNWDSLCSAVWLQAHKAVASIEQGQHRPIEQTVPLRKSHERGKREWCHGEVFGRFSNVRATAQQEAEWLSCWSEPGTPTEINTQTAAIQNTVHILLAMLFYSMSTECTIQPGHSLGSMLRTLAKMDDIVRGHRENLRHVRGDIEIWRQL